MGSISSIAKHRGIIPDNPKAFEDTSFVSGDSPVILDIKTALNRNGIEGYIINDGIGNITVSFSANGSTFGDAITMKKKEVLGFTEKSVNSIKITHSGTDSAYRVSVV